MRKISLFLLLTFMLTVVFVFPQTEVKKEVQKKDKLTTKDKLSFITRAYSTMEEELLVTTTDLYCSYFIRNKMSQDLIINGAEEMGSNRVNYSDEDRMYINKGSTSGIKEGDVFFHTRS